jgi:hypothetical protein
VNNDFKTSLYLATDPDHTAPIKIGSFGVPGGLLRANSGVLAIMHLAPPAALPSGNYYLYAVADEDDAVPESQKDDNNYLAPYRVSVTK